MVLLDVPVSVLPESITKEYYKDGNTKFVVTVDAEKQLDAIPAIYELIGDDNMLTGNAAITVVATINTVKGVAISLITTLLFMPGVILGTYKWMEKTSHR